LTLASEIEFPELYPYVQQGNISVTLKIGKTPKVESRPNGIHRPNLDITPHEYRLSIKDVADYYVSAGKTIIIEIHDNSSPDLVRLYCLSNAFAALLHQRKLIPIHSAALMINDQLLMILGDSGVGKSTTLAGLLKRGLKPFSDDVCVPVQYEGIWNFYASYPMMKFWKSTLDLDGIELKTDRRIRPDMEKYGLYFHDQFTISPKKPFVIFLLSKSDQISRSTLSRISGIDLFQHLEKNAYRGEYLPAADLRREHFHFFTSLANQVPCYRIERPKQGEPHHVVSDLIYKEISKLQHGGTVCTK
jgi:hypothetical protein